MKKILAGLFILGFLAMGSQADASVLSDALLQIQNLKNEIFQLRAILKGSAADIPMPPTLGATTYSNLTPNGVTLNSSVTDLGWTPLLTARGTCYGLASQGPIDNCLSDGVSALGSYSQDRSDLIAGTSYIAISYATNGTATSYGGSVAFTTPLSGSLPAVSTPTSSGYTQSSAILGANITSAGSPATIIDRGTCTGVSPSPTTGCVSAGGSFIGAFTHTRDGLTCGTKYYYRGYAKNATGTSYSPDNSFYTSGCTVAPTSVNVYTSSGPNGTILPTGPISVSSNVGQTKQFTITPSAGYTASVTGCEGSLSGNVYTTASITDACTVYATFAPVTTNSAPRVADVNWGFVTSSSAVLSVSNFYSGYPTGFTERGICYNANSISATPTTNCFASTLERAMITASGLSPNTTYKFRGYAKNSAGLTGYSEEGSFTTLSATDSSCVFSSFVATPSTITAGDPVTLSWSTNNCGPISLFNTEPVSGPSGSKVIYPAYTGSSSFFSTNSPYLQNVTLFTKTLDGTKTVTASLGIIVNPKTVTPPVSTCNATLSASPTTITLGGTTTLSWTSSNCSSVYISGVGSMTSLSGSKVVTPTMTTDYDLTAMASSSNFNKKTVRVTVNTAYPTLANIYTSSGANGTISPAGPISVQANTGQIKKFTITPKTGYTASVIGCEGSLSGDTYTTAPITSSCTVKATFTISTPVIIKTSPCAPYGDVNYDGYLSEKDIITIQENIGGLNYFIYDQTKRADVNKDGKVSVLDVTYMTDYISGTESTFPVCTIGTVAQITPTSDLTPRISVWQGKVNQHVEVSAKMWNTDPDGVSGAEIDKLTYCKKWYPNTTSVVEYKNETINAWHDRGNINDYPSTRMTYKCVQSVSTSTIKVLSPNGGESIKMGDKYNITWESQGPLSGNNVSLSLKKEGVICPPAPYTGCQSEFTIAYNVANYGSYIWDTNLKMSGPSTGPNSISVVPGAQYRIGVCGLSIGTCDYSDNAFIVSDTVVPITPTTDLTPRISVWQGKVNQHVDVASKMWQTDADGVSGADIDKLTYCKKWYPNTTSVVEYKTETINTWQERYNLNYYPSTRMSYKCVESVSDNLGKITQSLDTNSHVDMTVSSGSNDVEVVSIALRNTGTTEVFLNGLHLASSANLNNYINHVKVFDSSTNKQVGQTINKFDYNGEYYYAWVNSPASVSIPAGTKKVFRVLADIPNSALLGTFSVGNWGLNFDAPGAVMSPQKINGNTITIKSNTTSSINVLSPGEGDRFKIGNQITVKWNSNGVLPTSQVVMTLENVNSGVIIYLTEDKNVPAIFTTNDGIETFKIPTSDYANVKTGDYKITISTLASDGKTSVSDRSDLFTIVASDSTPSLSVLYPKGGEIFKAGQQITAKWKTENIPSSETVLIEITRAYKSGDFYGGWTTLSEATPNDGIQTVTLGSNLPSGEYQFVIRRNSLLLDGDGLSDGLFTITSENISCPLISQPAPSYCFNGKIEAVQDYNKCIISYKCVNSNGPVISGVSGPQSLALNQTGTWTITASNPNGGNLSYSVDWGEPTATPWLKSATAPQQTATFTHSYSQPGIYTPIFTATSENTIRCITTPCPSNGGSAETSLSVNVGSSTTYIKNNPGTTPMAMYNAKIFRTLKIGVKGEDVKRLQEFLGLDIDGNFGPMTARKVAEWQAANGLTPDGKFGYFSRVKAGLDN